MKKGEVMRASPIVLTMVVVLIGATLTTWAPWDAQAQTQSQAIYVTDMTVAGWTVFGNRGKGTHQFLRPFEITIR